MPNAAQRGAALSVIHEAIMGPRGGGHINAASEILGR